MPAGGGEWLMPRESTVTPGARENQWSELQAWRERTVHVVLWTVLAVSVIPLVFILLQAFQVYHDWLPLLCILTSYFFILIPLCVFRKLGHRVRGWGLLVVGYVLAVVSFIRAGLIGDGRLYLFALPLAAIALVGTRAGILSGTISLLIYGWFIFAGSRGQLDSFMGSEESLLPMSVWLGGAAAFAMFMVAVMLMVGLLMNHLQRALGRARSEAVKNQAILEGIADGVIVFDNKWQVIGVNPAAADLMGQPVEGFVGRDVASLMGSGDVTVDADTWTVMHEMIEHGEPVRFEWGTRTFSASLAQFRGPSGAALGNVAVLRDVTREVEVQRARDSLFAVAAHELRTPLNAIVNFSRLLQDGLVPASMRHETVARIMANAERLLVLANNLLERARLEAGEVRLNIERVDPAELIDEVQDVMSVLAQEKGLALTFHVEEDVPSTLLTDHRQLHQVLINLVGNAVKFTDEGSVRVRVYVPDADHWALEVSDTGNGIPQEARSRIFEPFELAEDPVTRRQAGAGLGLSIAKQMVTLMGGEMLLTSEVGEGSMFTVVLPTSPDARGGQLTI
jgi:PAS domain S-box-containing protein